MPVRLKTIFLAFVLLHVAVPDAADALPEKFVVREMSLVGVRSLPKKELRKRLAATPRPFWRFWEAEAPLTDWDLKDDVERIRQFYRERGYYRTRIDLTAETTGSDADNVKGETGPPLPVVRVRYEVTEGPPVRIAEIRVEHPPEGPVDEAIIDAVPLEKGEIFTIEDYRLAKRKIQRVYENKGFPFADVDGKVTVDVDENLARIDLSVSAGEAYRFGDIEIAQDGEAVEEAIVRRAIQFEAGSPYSASAVEMSQRNLVNLEIFRSALIVPGDPVESSDRLPMEVRLQTKEPRQIGFGVGYGSEDGLRLKASWTYRNLLGRAGRLILSARRTDLIENVQAEFVQPYWLDDRTDLRLWTGWEREDLESYVNEKTFLNGAVSRRFSRLWGGSVGYKLSGNRLEEIKILDPIEIEELLKNNQYLVSAVRFGVTRRSADDLLYPTEGTEISLASEQASGLIGSELDYVRPTAEFKVYHTLAVPVTLAGRLRLEAIQEIEDTEFIPISERLFLGGSNSVRGYGYQMLGPLDPTGNPLGGKSAANANLEARFPIYRSFSGLVFFDAGLVDPEAFRYELDEVRTACGAGFRYDSVIGPLRVEVGYKLNPAEEDELPAGVAPENRWRLHFSVGQTF